MSRRVVLVHVPNQFVAVTIDTTGWDEALHVDLACRTLAEETVQNFGHFSAAAVVDTDRLSATATSVKAASCPG